MMPPPDHDPITHPPTRLTCQRVTEMLTDYMTGDLDAATTLALEAHLQNCLDCTAFFNTYKATVSEARALRYEEIPAEMQERLHRFLRTHTANLPPPD